MRRIAFAFALVALFAACDSSSGGVCEEPVEVLRPELETGTYDGTESHCQLALFCMHNAECNDESCAVACIENTFGADDCGCCGDECEDVCSQVLESAWSLHMCDTPDSQLSTNECISVASACAELNFDGRVAVDG